MLKSIDENYTKLFLFNYNTRELFGIYEPDGPGGLNLEPDAWTNGSGRLTKFGAQIRFKIIRDCPPLRENVFKAHLPVSDLVIHCLFTRHAFARPTYHALPPLSAALCADTSMPPTA